MSPPVGTEYTVAEVALLAETDVLHTRRSRDPPLIIGREAALTPALPRCERARVECLRQDLETLHEPRARRLPSATITRSRMARSSCQPGRSSRSGMSARVREISKPQGETKTNVGIGGAEVVPVEPGRVLARLSEERRATGHGASSGIQLPADVRGSIHSVQATHGREANRRAVDSTAAIRSRSEATNRAPARSLVQLMGLDLVVPSYSRVRGGNGGGVAISR